MVENKNMWIPYFGLKKSKNRLIKVKRIIYKNRDMDRLKLIVLNNYRYRILF